MSILIKGMKMPRNCSECPVALSGKYCRINKTYTTYIELPIRPDYCPLVELPEKHGRLIDEDIAYDKIAEQDGGYYMDMDGVGIGLSETPTIIEAEGEDG